MTFFENILKKRLGDATSTKGVAPDDLWAAIEQGLPPEEEIIPPVKWGRISWVLLGLFLALVGSFSVFLWEKAVDVPGTFATESLNENLIASEEKGTVQFIENDNEAEGSPSNEMEALIESNENIPKNLQDEMSASDLFDPSAHVSGGNTQREAQSSSATHKTVPSSLQPIDKSATAYREDVTEHNEPEPGLTDELLVNSLSETSEEDGKAIGSGSEPLSAEFTRVSEPIAIRNTTSVRKLDNELQILAPIRTNEVVGIENFKAITPVKELRSPRSVLGVFVGSNMLRHKYPSTATDDLADVLNATRGEALGQSAALEFGYRLRPGLKVYTGIELLKTHTTFRYTQQWDTVTLRNGQEVDAIATRRVQHNNRQTLLSVPLMLEKTFAAGRWEAGLAAGVSLNYLTQQTGRSLNALQEVVSYSSGDGTNLPAPNFYLSYQLRPSINYRLNNRMSIQARVDLRWQRYGKSALYEQSANSMLYGGSFGVVFGL